MIKFGSFAELLATVKGKANRVAVPGATNLEALEAIKMADANGLISGGVLIGDVPVVKEMASQAGLDLNKFEYIQATDVPEMCRLAVECITTGRANFLLKGLVDTKFYMKAILNKEAKLVPPGSLLSHFVLFRSSHYRKMVVITDAAVMIAPTLEQKAKIIQNAVDVLRRLGVERPKVSVICPVEKVNEKIQSSVDAAELARMNREGLIKNCVVEGPYDIYITFSRKLAEEKGISGGEVPGDADVILLPSLDAANALYKSIAFFGEEFSAATIVVGASVPVILPSRADAPAIKLNSIALCSFLQQQKAAA